MGRGENRRDYVGVARAREGMDVICSAGHGEITCLGYFGFKIFLIASKGEAIQTIGYLWEKKKLKKN